MICLFLNFYNFYFLQFFYNVFTLKTFNIKKIILIKSNLMKFFFSRNFSIIHATENTFQRYTLTLRTLQTLHCTP